MYYLHCSILVSSCNHLRLTSVEHSTLMEEGGFKILGLCSVESACSRAIWLGVGPLEYVSVGFSHNHGT